MTTPLDLVGFAKGVMKVWPDDLPGDEIQELAVKHGLLEPQTRHSFCNTEEEAEHGSTSCPCREFLDDGDLKRGFTCYRCVKLQ